MNENYKHDLIEYRLQRAKETYKEALFMQQECHWNACANRLYYACFYAVSALLVKGGLHSGKHIGIKSLFNKHFVKTGIVSKEYGKLYSRLFEARQEADYVDFVVFERDAIEPWIQEVKEFIENISQLAQN